MLSLRKDEKLVIVVRQHWWALTAPAITLAFLIIAPAIVVLFSSVNSFVQITPTSPLFKFATALYFLFLVIFAFLVWMEYYLDVWIITTRRIIDIDQKSLFHRVVSEIPLSRIQNVTIDINGIIETFLKFGDITVETAGEFGKFTMPNSPLPNEIKDAILRYAHVAMEREEPITRTTD